MAQGQTGPGKKHRLEVYFRLGQSMRMGPLLIALLGLALLGLLFLAERYIIVIPGLRLDRRPFAVVLIVLGAALYVANIFISRVSVVQARPDHLYVRAGLVPLVISYARVRRLRPVQVGQQYPPKSLKERERALMEPFLGMTAVAVDLRSFPISEAALRRLWSKFMFVADEQGVMLVVKDAMGLLREIDEQRQKYQERKLASDNPRDVFERVAKEHRKR